MPSTELRFSGRKKKKKFRFLLCTTWYCLWRTPSSIHAHKAFTILLVPSACRVGSGSLRTMVINKRLLLLGSHCCFCAAALCKHRFGAALLSAHFLNSNRFSCGLVYGLRFADRFSCRRHSGSFYVPSLRTLMAVDMRFLCVCRRAALLSRHRYRRQFSTITIRRRWRNDTFAARRAVGGHGTERRAQAGGAALAAVWVQALVAYLLPPRISMVGSSAIRSLFCSRDGGSVQRCWFCIYRCYSVLSAGENAVWILVLP